MGNIHKLLVTLCLLATVPNTLASDSRSSIQQTLSKPEIRGGIVFKHYCILCHGERGDGEARASKLYKSAKLDIKSDTVINYLSIIRKGGKIMGKSEFMPPWENELSDEQIMDVVAYLGVVTQVVKRGEVVFKTNCILCHGIKGNGEGRAAKLYNPPPADLTISDKNADYKTMIIRLGGKAMGRSEVMPSWAEQLSNQEISDLVIYLNTLVNH